MEREYMCSFFKTDKTPKGINHFLYKQGSGLLCSFLILATSDNYY